jgi:four helix bundle protein
MHNFRELNIWKKSLDLSVDVYRITQEFPVSEKYNLISQIVRSAVSIPSNIAEGSGRGTNKDFCRFLSIALGSAYELETQLIISNKLGYLTKNKYDMINNSLNELQKMIFGFKRTLN